MSAPGLAALAFGLGVVALLLRHRPTLPWLVGVVGFGLVFLASWTLPVGLRTAVGGETFATTGYLRLFIALLAITGGVLTLVAWAAALTRALPGLALVWVAAAAGGLAVADPLTAILILTTGSLVPVLAGVPPGGAHDAGILGRGVRAVVVSGLLAALALPLAVLAATVLAATPDGRSESAAAAAAGTFGVALLCSAGGLALRSGAVPLHGWLGRLSEALDAPAIPVIFAWGPAAFAIVLLGWSDGTLLPEQPLVLERLVIHAVALASLVLGSVAALLHDDLEHVVGYSLVSDAGVLLLAVTVLDPAGWGAARTWILAYVVAKSAFAGWATALGLAYGTRRISDLGGWARRSPLLAGSLVVIGVTAVGVPGLAAFEARSRLVDLALDGPLNLVARLGVLASAGYFARLLVSGFSPPSARVALAVDLQPAWPGGGPDRVSGDVVRQVPGAIRQNRRPAAALAIFGLALLGLAVASGAFRGPALAAQPGPAASAAPSPGASPSPSSSPAAAPSRSPLVVPTPTLLPGSSVPGGPTPGATPPG
jgi:NADH:ubiquinone oxidoreductase subunit 2 (subunit N)